MKKTLLCLAALFVFFAAYSQNSSLEKIYSNYFENTREVPYLHLNKTTFLKGQEIWFKAYVLEQNSKKLHPTTTNLFVSIFNSNGKLKKQKLIHLKNGIGNGNFLIDSTYTNEYYYLKASTNWMRNFKEDNSFIQKITIQNNQISKKQSSTQNNYEFKIFPEGGHILANTTNNLGILIKDQNGKGLQIKEGIVKNNRGKVIKYFDTNSFGLGNINLFIKENEKFNLQVTLANGEVLNSYTQHPQSIGIGMRVINSNPKYSLINILTNKKSLKVLKNRTFKILVHNTKKVTTHKFTFNPKKNKYSLFISKKNLDKGIHIITVFDDNNNPLLERLIFVNDTSLFTDLDIAIDENIQTERDSLTISLKNNSNENIYASASFLPLESKSYSPKTNIYTTSLLKPYIRGYIDNPNYFFNNITAKKLRTLDLLLITQGWSKYNWFNIFQSPPKTNYSFENGIDITGTLNQSLKNNQSLILFSPENNLLKTFKNAKKFKLTNSFIKENSGFIFLLKTKNQAYNKTPYLQFSKTSLNESIHIENLDFDNQNSIELKNPIPPFKTSEVLDEVIINKKKEAPIKNKPYGYNVFLTSKKTSDLLFISSGETIIDYLRTNRFKTQNTDGRLTILPRQAYGSLTNVSTTNSSQDSLNTMNVNLKLGVRVFLDNNEVTHSIWMLESLFLDNVKEVVFGRVFDPRADEHIYIYTLSPQEYATRNNRKNPNKIIISKGFAIEKEYYSPEYTSYAEDTFNYFGDIFWHPKISVHPNAKFTFKIPKKFQQNIIVYIEGISDSGKLISKKYIRAKNSN